MWFAQRNRWCDTCGGRRANQGATAHHMPWNCAIAHNGTCPGDSEAFVHRSGTLFSMTERPETSLLTGSAPAYARARKSAGKEAGEIGYCRRPLWLGPRRCEIAFLKLITYPYNSLEFARGQWQQASNAMILRTDFSEG